MSYTAVLKNSGKAGLKQTDKLLLVKGLGGDDDPGDAAAGTTQQEQAEKSPHHLAVAEVISIACLLIRTSAWSRSACKYFA